ncbi:pentatricopeptide repeat-containing protein, partial [Tanacetum coccineum]
VLMDPPDDVNMPDLGAENDDELGDEIGDEIFADIGETLDNEDVVQKYIKEEVIAKQKTLDKGKGVMSLDKGDGVRKKRMSRPRGNGISIRENEDPSCGSNSDSESETHLENQMYMSDDSESGESLKSFDYLSEGEAEVIELRKRMTQFRSGGAEGEEEVKGGDNDQNDSFDNEGFVTPKRMFDMGISDTVKEHELDVNALMRRIKGKGCELKDPFTMVDKTEKYPIYDEATHWKLKKPKFGEKFVNVDQFKECLTYYALANGFSLWYATSSTDRVIAKCGHRKEVIKDPSKGKQRQYKKFPTRDPTKVDVCLSMEMLWENVKGVNSFKVISLKDEYTCVRNYNYGTLINYKWLGKHFGDKIRANPHIRLLDIADLVIKKYNCIVSPNQCRREKSYALSEGESSLQDHYGLLRSYAKEIVESNVGSTVKVSVAVNPVGRDGNNQIYPVAWAIVTVENKDNWSWFLFLLGDDLDLPTGCGLTLISDQHKGLIEAVKEVMPYAKHRQCTRHIYEGFRKQYSGVESRQLFWAASKASYPQLAFFCKGANCEAVENGFSECFNAVLVSVRHKPIITMLESMRVLVMERMHTMRLIMEKWTGEVCPKIQSILEHTKDQQRFWHVIPAGESKFEVRKGYDAFTVDEVANTCSCRMWQISGLPCVHDVACIFKLNKMVEPYVPECFKIEMFKQAYTQFMKPVEGITFWPDCSRLSRILGPLPKKMPGRPKKKRIRASHESQSTTKISRSGLEMTCHNCWQKGHNKKGCKNDPIPKTPKVKGKVGRPKKTIPTENTNLVDDEDLPRFVNNSINEFYNAASKNYVVFNDGVRINLGRNWNTNKRGGKSGGTCFVKMRGGKSSRGGLVPTKRLGRIGGWLGLDATISDPTEDRQPFQRSQVATNFNIIDTGTQQSQVDGVQARMKSNARTSHGTKKTLRVKLIRGKH